MFAAVEFFIHFVKCSEKAQFPLSISFIRVQIVLSRKKKKKGCLSQAWFICEATFAIVDPYNSRLQLRDISEDYPHQLLTIPLEMSSFLNP